MHSIHKGRLAAVTLLFGLAVILGLWASGAEQTNAALSTPYIRIEGPGIAAPVGVGSNFDIEVWVDSGTTVFNTYQVNLDVPTNTSWMSGTHETSPFTTCYTWPTGPIAGPVSESTSCGKTGDQTYGTPEKLVETLTLRCDAAGTWNLNLEDATENSGGGTYFIDASGPVVTNTTPDNEQKVKCVNATNITTKKSNDVSGLVAPDTVFNYTIVAKNNEAVGGSNAIGLVVADPLPDISDGDGRGMKLLAGTIGLGVDTTGDTVPDSPYTGLLCKPGWLGLYVNPFPPPTYFHSLVACSGYVEVTYYAQPAILNALPPQNSVVVTIPVKAPSADTGQLNFNIAQGVLDCTPPPDGLGDPNCTYDPDMTNETDCPTVLPDPAHPGQYIAFPAANTGCDFTQIKHVAMTLTKTPDFAARKDGEPITWTVTASVDTSAGAPAGYGSPASSPYGEGYDPTLASPPLNSVLNCWDNADNDTSPDPGYGFKDFDGAGSSALIDPRCANTAPTTPAEWGPVITDTLTNQSGITASIAGGTCRETGGVPRVSGLTVRCSLVAPIDSSNPATLTIHSTAVAPSAPANCDDSATITYADKSPLGSKTTAGHVACTPKGVMDHKDKGVFVFPPVIDVLVGSHGKVIVAETLEIVTPGPTPLLMHTWYASTTYGNGVGLHWDAVTGDTVTPSTPSNWTQDIFTTSGHVPGLITLSRVIDVSCTAADGEKTVNLSLESTGAKDIFSTNTLIVQCFDQPQEVKVPAQANLWLMRHPNCGPENLLPPCDPTTGKGNLLIQEKGSAIANGHGDPGGLGAYEKQIKFDHKLFNLVVTDSGFLSNGGARSVNCTMTIVTENWIMFGCVSTGAADGPTATGPVTLTNILVKPQPDLFLRLHPTKDNGVVSTIIDENCEWADAFGNPMAGMVNGGLVPICTNATITIRMLEGDLNNDCNVDVLDEQGIAFRYGASFGLQLYNAYYDLQPQTGDFDIDIKDLQFVFGREGSTCSVPIPAQPASAPIP
jgi:hypothetical protein